MLLTGSGNVAVQRIGSRRRGGLPVFSLLPMNALVRPLSFPAVCPCIVAVSVPVVGLRACLGGRIVR